MIKLTKFPLKNVQDSLLDKINNYRFEVRSK